MAKVRITLVKSPIGRLTKHRRTVERLGLRKMWQTVERERTPQLEGMLEAVHYLVRVEEAGQ